MVIISGVPIFRIFTVYHPMNPIHAIYTRLLSENALRRLLEQVRYKVYNNCTVITEMQ